MATSKHQTWYEQQQRRKNSPLLRLIDRSFRFRLLLASGTAFLLLSGLNRLETCRASGYAANCVWQDVGSLLSVGNLEAYSIATAALLYLLEGERRHEQANREAYENILMASQHNLVYSPGRVRALESLSDAGCILDGLDLHGAHLDRLQIPNSRLRQVNLSGTILTQADLQGCDLTQVNLTEADLTGANLRGANLTEADLTGAILTDANLTEANLTGANLRGANLTEASLTGAILTDANLTEAILVGATLD